MIVIYSTCISKWDLFTKIRVPDDYYVSRSYTKYETIDYLISFKISLKLFQS